MTFSRTIRTAPASQTPHADNPHRPTHRASRARTGNGRARRPARAGAVAPRAPYGEAAERKALARLALSFALACGIVASAFLASTPERAEAVEQTISGVCYVECTNPQIDGPTGGNAFIVRFPQYGIETTGVCISGPLYGTPMPGNYPFTGTLGADGGYRITVDCAGAAMYPNHYSSYGAQNVGGFSIYLHGSVELFKHGNADYAAQVPGATLEGATYELVAADGSLRRDLVTNADGWAAAYDLPIGDYTVRETTASGGYALDTTAYAVTVAHNRAARVDSAEGLLLGAVGVEKASSAPSVTDGNPLYTLAGAVFGVYADEACTREVQQIVTGADGRGTCAPMLWPGSYWIREIAAPDGFTADATAHRVELGVEDCTAARIAIASVRDDPVLADADIVVVKRDAERGEVPQGDASLAGAVFAVEHYAGAFATATDARASGLSPTFSCTVVTDETGAARIDPALLPSAGGATGLPLGTLIVTETSPPPGYLLPSDAAIARPIALDAHDRQTATFSHAEASDEVIRGDIAIEKVGALEGSTGSDAPDGPLAGVAFDIAHRATGTVVCRLVTDGSGRASTVGTGGAHGAGALPYGVYEVREDPATTPAGYRAADPFTVTIAQDGALMRYTVENTTGTHLRIVKQDADTGRQIAGIMTFRILDASGAPVSFPTPEEAHDPHAGAAAGAPNAPDASSGAHDASEPTDAPLLATDEEGVCTVPVPLNGGATYYIEEVSPPIGYALSTDRVAFTIGGDGAGRSDDDPLVVTVSDHAQTVSLTVEKTDAETGRAVPQEGTAWDVIADEDVATPDGTVRAPAGSTVARIESDERGCATAEGLYPGTYRIVETRAPHGYALASQPVRVTIPADGSGRSVIAWTASAPDAPARGIVEIRKTDAASGDPLAEAVYEVRAAEDIVTPDGTVRLQAGELADTLATGTDGIAQSEALYLGTYTITETQAPHGYLIDETARTVELRSAGQDEACTAMRVDLADERVLDEEAALAPTGDRPRIGLHAIGACAATAAAAAAAAIAARRRHSRRNAA